MNIAIHTYLHTSECCSRAYAWHGLTGKTFDQKAEVKWADAILHKSRNGTFLGSTDILAAGAASQYFNCFDVVIVVKI